MSRAAGFFVSLTCSSFFRAMKAGMQRPLLVCPPHQDYKNSSMVAALGALHALYMVRGHGPPASRRFKDLADTLLKGYQCVLWLCPHVPTYKMSAGSMLTFKIIYIFPLSPQKPLEVREASVKPTKVCVLGLWASQEAEGRRLVELAEALESGRWMETLHLRHC